MAEGKPAAPRPWTVEFDDRARRELRKLDAGVQRTPSFAICGNALSQAPTIREGSASRFAATSPVSGDTESKTTASSAALEEDKVVVLVLQVGHRRDIYEE